jgi:hypothetical protein
LKQFFIVLIHCLEAVKYRCGAINLSIKMSKLSLDNNKYMPLLKILLLVCLSARLPPPTTSRRR